MKITGPHKMHSLRPVGLGWPGAGWRRVKAVGGALAFSALWLLAANCRAVEPPLPGPVSARDFTVHAAAVGGEHRFDIVLIELEGRGPQGYRYRIVLDSPARGAQSSLDLAIAEGGLVVHARDVDGIGNDPDLIIKTARSLKPVGIWINNHHGGFTKADASVYAPSIWSEVPRLISHGSPDLFCQAFLLWHQSHIQPPVQACPGERKTCAGFVELPGHATAYRLTADLLHTRGPPTASSEEHS